MTTPDARAAAVIVAARAAVNAYAGPPSQFGPLDVAGAMHDLAVVLGDCPFCAPGTCPGDERVAGPGDYVDTPPL
jgi:hypothetical protein